MRYVELYVNTNTSSDCIRVCWLKASCTLRIIHHTLHLVICQVLFPVFGPAERDFDRHKQICTWPADRFFDVVILQQDVGFKSMLATDIVGSILFPRFEFLLRPQQAAVMKAVKVRCGGNWFHSDPSHCPTSWYRDTSLQGFGNLSVVGPITNYCHDLVTAGSLGCPFAIFVPSRAA